MSGAWKRRAAGLLLVAGPLAWSAAPCVAWAESPSLRSVKDVRPRIPDELDRPVRRETSSHRGWEVREDQFTIVANTSQDDARWAAAAVKLAWGETATLADRFTAVHRQADFGLNSLQVAIDDNPPRERDAPQTTIDVVGIQTQVVLHVGPGQPPLADQIVRLREGAAFAVLHAAELDSLLPPWVVSGLAGQIALQGQPRGGPLPTDFAPRGELLGGDAWRWNRATPDRLASHSRDRTGDAAKIGFLLTGSDAQQAPALLAEIVAAIDRGREQAARANPVAHRRGDEQPAAVQPRFERLIADHRAGYNAWLKDPRTGQPQFQPDDKTPPELAAEQREMLVVLKLQRRLKTTPADQPSMAAMAAKLRDPSRLPVATLDVDGSLLLSTDRRRMEQLLGWDAQRYRVEQSGEQWVLTTRLPDGRVLQGWLADDPQQPDRPLVKFTVSERALPTAEAKVTAR